MVARSVAESGAMPPTPKNPDFERLVRESFLKQEVMATLGATLARIAPGEVEIELPYRAALTQQHGFLHAGIVTAVLDSSCGYAAFSLMPPGAGVLSVEFKVNLLRPAQGETFVARAEVIKAGKTLTVVRADVFAANADRDRELVATMQGTMICLRKDGSVG